MNRNTFTTLNIGMSKKKLLVDQYNTIREAIKQNLATIKMLISQYKMLVDFSQWLWAGEGGVDTKANIQSTLEQLLDTIATLVDQNDKLYNDYEKFAAEIFND